MEKQLEFLDTTLRDGAQAVGIGFSKSDMSSILGLLDAFGIQLVEVGVANPKDRAFLYNTPNRKLVAFGATRRKDSIVQSDDGLKNLLDANTDTVCIFGKADKEQAEYVLGVSAKENLRMIKDSIEYLASNDKRVIFDAEHFFDAYIRNKDYALEVLRTAYAAGADTLTLCDTNGGTMPWQIFDAVKAVVDELGGNVKIGIHAHNDCGLAVACTLMAVKAGATHVQGTFLGFGERCGNAELSTVIANLQLKMSADTFCNLRGLTTTARKLAEIANIRLDCRMPYVGTSAFTHKAGTHVDAILKNERTFEHVFPSAVGNEHKLVLSDVAGRSAVSQKLKTLFHNIDKAHPKTKEILDTVKNLEKDGFQFDTADGSFALLAERMLDVYIPSFELVHYRITESQPDGVSVADVSIKVDEVTTSVTENGNGPVNALDKALRSALAKHYPQIADMSLLDYKVRVIDFTAATGAMVRVLITSTDGKDSWTTVGVSTDVIEASWLALKDSFEYKLTGQRKFI